MNSVILYSLLIGCVTVKSPQSPLKHMLGDWEEQGTVWVDGTSNSVYAHSTCSQLSSLNDVICNGQTGEGYAWLDVYRWNPQTHVVDFQSLSTTPGERVCQGTGKWDASTQTVYIDGSIRLGNGEQQGIRMERTFSPEGQSDLQHFLTINGAETRTLEIQSSPHKTMTIDYKLPFELLGTSYKSWLRVSIDPQSKVMQGCRVERKGECDAEPEFIALNRDDLQQYYLHKQRLFPLTECTTISPHAHDIVADIRLGERTYKNTFYYNPNGMQHHHLNDACPQVSTMAEWAYQIWSERKSIH
mgnify:CR=1 FL=1